MSNAPRRSYAMLTIPLCRRCKNINFKDIGSKDIYQVRPTFGSVFEHTLTAFYGTARSASRGQSAQQLGQDVEHKGETMYCAARSIPGLTLLS